VFKFSLKALLILITLFSIGLGVWINGYQTALRESLDNTPSKLISSEREIQSPVFEQSLVLE